MYLTQSYPTKTATNLAQQAAAFACRFVATHHNPGRHYHNLQRTKKVAALVEEIGKANSMSTSEFSLAETAAWFLYLGYCANPGDAITSSAQLAAAFLRQQHLPEHEIAIVTTAILATAQKAEVNNTVAAVLCDAETACTAAPQFWEERKQLLAELQQLQRQRISRHEWLQRTIAYLEEHRFHTAYAKEHLEKGKQRNLQRLRKRLLSVPNSGQTLAELLRAPVDDANNKVESRMEKTVETMFRITAGNSQKLSDQADTKAHIMISVNSIIISVLLTMVVRHMDEHHELTVPVVMLLTVNLLTILFSILATRPNVPAGVFKLDDVKTQQVNLLFFGNFYRMPFDDYCDGMNHLMNDHAFLKRSLLRDIYNQGVVLGRKYKFLKLAYNIFMFGLIVSVIVFFAVARW